MKLRNLFIVLLAVFMVIAFASCNSEPKDNPKPEPGPNTPAEIYQIEVTEGVDKDYWNRDKIKLQWAEEVKEGDVLSLKYRSERDIYQWDIRDGELKWVYESKKGSFTDPVLGDDGWYTLTYTFAKDINGAGVDYPNDQFSVFFRGNFVTTDIFEIKEITLNGKPLAVAQENIISKAELTDPKIDFDWTVKNYTVLFALGTPGEVDKTPIAEKVVAGGLVTGAPIAKDGYTLRIFTDSSRTQEFDPKTPITEEKIFYYQYIGVPRTVTLDLKGGSFPENVEASATIANGSPFVAPAEPTKEGVAFKAWYKDSDCTTPWVMTDSVLGDMTLYAGYAEPRTVTFELNGGTFGEGVANTKIVADGNAVARPETDPTNGSKMFLGWYADEELTTAYDFSTPVTADVKVYAAWVNSTDVTLYVDGQKLSTFKTALDVALSADDKNLDIKKSGYVLEGWYDEATCETSHDFTAVVTGPLTLYAKWVAKKIANFTANKGITDKKSSYEKFQLNIDLRDVMGDDAGVQSGDTLTLKFRSTRDFYDYDIRTNKKVKQGGTDKEIDVRWVYEGFSGTLAKPVLGNDGWYTMTYTFGDSYYTSKTKPNYETDQYYNIGLNFRGYLIAGDIFDVKNVTYTRGENTYDIDIKSSYNAASFTSFAEVDETAWTDPKTYAVIYNINGDGSYPATEAVVSGKAAKGLSEGGYKFEYFSDEGKTTPFDLTTEITKDTMVYVTKSEATYVLTATNTGDRFQFKWDDLAIKDGDVITFEYQCAKPVTSHTTRSISPSEKFVDNEELTGEANEGWYTFSYTIPEGKDATGLGIALFVTDIAADDVMKIKGITLNETKLSLAQANSWAGCSPTITVE